MEKKWWVVLLVSIKEMCLFFVTEDIYFLHISEDITYNDILANLEHITSATQWCWKMDNVTSTRDVLTFDSKNNLTGL